MGANFCAFKSFKTTSGRRAIRETSRALKDNRCQLKGENFEANKL
jgi:hypothetical protein